MHKAILQTVFVVNVCCSMRFHSCNVSWRACNRLVNVRALVNNEWRLSDRMQMNQHTHSKQKEKKCKWVEAIQCRKIHSNYAIKLELLLNKISGLVNRFCVLLLLSDSCPLHNITYIFLRMRITSVALLRVLKMKNLIQTDVCLCVYARMRSTKIDEFE